MDSFCQHLFRMEAKAEPTGIVFTAFDNKEGMAALLASLKSRAWRLVSLTAKIV